MGFLNRLPARQDGYYNRNRMWKNKGSDTAANRRTLVSPSHMLVNIGGAGAHAYELEAALEMDLDESWVWDTQTPDDYTVAANRAGKDFYVYACIPGSGFSPILILSAATTYPYGYTAADSRKIGGFHCECADVGIISGHTLTGYLAGDIIPRSIQDLHHRPYGRFLPGFAWGGPTDFDSLNYAPLWASIYHLSGTGANIASVFGAAATVSRDFYNFADDLKNIGARMMTDWEFAQLHSGSPEETNIFGSANPTTVGGHVDTASRRIVSNIGLEDMSGVWWIWLQNQQSYIAGADYDAAIAFGYENISGTRGSHYGQGTYQAQAAVLAGGAWNDAAYCGSRARHALTRRSAAPSNIGCRAVAEPQ
ncbi:MAG: hypothetical protein PHD57_10095 [Desulfobacterales bacterium]|nr:hypothetical protein [Desulfobacterales bacterium]